MKKTELLAPAGSIEAFRSAVAAGADAVYMGGGEFNARINAKNLTDRELESAIYHAHLNGVKVYITLNTLVRDTEMTKAAEFAHRFTNIGADAFIVQDFGLAKYLREVIPDIQLHASTQMACHNAEAAVFLAKHGFSRMVVCREVSREDLKILCKKSPVEIEMFVHGAICMSQSGQCLMSSFIGGRSGNRGECAQPCRMEYKGDGYALSMYDMCLAQHIPEIISLGVSSLKIEGRMKSPEYVYGVTSVYRKLIDCNRPPEKKEIDFLSSLFSRGGRFTDAYYVGNKNSCSAEDLKCWGARRTEQNKKETELTESKIKRELSLISPLSVPPQKEIPQFIPSRQPKTAMSMKKQKKAQKMGIRICFAHGSRFSDKLCENILSENYEDKYLEGIYFPLVSAPDMKDERYGIITPAEARDTKQSDFCRQLETASQKGYKNCLVTNISHINSVKSKGFRLHAAPEMNIYNSESVKAWREEDFSSVTLSYENNPAQIRDTDKYKIPCGVTVYGRVPLMVLESCLVSSTGKNRRSCSQCRAGCTAKGRLTDRTERVFPLFCDGQGKNILFNSVPLCATDKIQLFYSGGVSFATLYFTDEKPEEIMKIIKQAIKEKNNIKDYTRGYLK
ncbi:MAG: U32 family peptidase [Clostridia bacterium]|nr:U32 family peptidase [Clostridia bacterium]